MVGGFLFWQITWQIMQCFAVFLTKIKVAHAAENNACTPLYGAENGSRTRRLLLGKQPLYRMSYPRMEDKAIITQHEKKSISFSDNVQNVAGCATII